VSMDPDAEDIGRLEAGGDGIIDVLGDGVVIELEGGTADQLLDEGQVGDK